jgi:SRSO17 transposase
VSGLRWPIESCFEESKEEVGLYHYELRFWRGWHHHMTTVILAHHFLVRLRLRLTARGGGANSSRPKRRTAISSANIAAGMCTPCRLSRTRGE